MLDFVSFPTVRIVSVRHHLCAPCSTFEQGVCTGFANQIASPVFIRHSPFNFRNLYKMAGLMSLSIAQLCDHSTYIHLDAELLLPSLHIFSTSLPQECVKKKKESKSAPSFTRPRYLNKSKYTLVKLLYMSYFQKTVVCSLCISFQRLPASTFASCARLHCASPGYC